MKREKFQKVFSRISMNAAGMRIYLFEKTGNSHDLIKRICKSAFLFVYIFMFADGKTATIYKTDLQLLSKKCEDFLENLNGLRLFGKVKLEVLND